MTASLAAAPAVRIETRTARPSFIGLVRGEFLKVSRQWSTWIMLVLLAGVIALPNLLTLMNTQRIKQGLQLAPLDSLYRQMGEDMLVLRVFIGIFLVIVTARLIGMEYSHGTIRIILSRGVGRLQLLFAKLTTVGIIAVIVLACGLVLDIVLGVLMLSIVAGNLDALKALNSGFWQDTWLYTETILVSMALTILMATAMSVLGRSLAFGLSASLAWFPVDNIGVIFFYLAFRLTNSNFWTLATGDLLGPNLNVMAGTLLPKRASEAVIDRFSAPFVPVTGSHTLLIAAIYAVIFAAVAIVLTSIRDVKE